MLWRVQVMLHELLAKTWGRSGFESFIKRLQAQYARQAAVAEEAAEQQLAGLAEWQPARAGMFMWFRLTGEALWQSCPPVLSCCACGSSCIYSVHTQSSHVRYILRRLVRTGCHDTNQF